MSKFSLQQWEAERKAEQIQQAFYERKALRDAHWQLEIRSFYGVVLGAVHFSGVIQRSCYVPHPTEPDTWLTFTEKCRVERALKGGEAIRLSTDDFKWEKGDYTDRYWAKSQVIKRAKVLFPLIASEGDFLTLNHGDRLLYGTQDGYERPKTGRTLGGFLGEGVVGPKDIEHDVQELEESSE